MANVRRSYSAGKLVKDPVCGTYVPADTAIQAKGEFFCSEDCRGKFLAT
jgi:YHS domain-containing protein